LKVLNGLEFEAQCELHYARLVQQAGVVAKRWTRGQ